MAFVIHDEAVARDALSQFERAWPDRNYEVWEGDPVVSPLGNLDHVALIDGLVAALRDIVDRAAGDWALGPCNVSDRFHDWERNYRNPDCSVYLRTNPAVRHPTHWQGGPDLAIEVVSPGERPRDKFPFYAHIGTREVLLVHRDPWRLELWRPAGGVMALAASAGPDDPPVASAALPVSFGLAPGRERTEVVVARAADGRTWTA